MNSDGWQEFERTFQAVDQLVEKLEKENRKLRAALDQALKLAFDAVTPEQVKSAIFSLQTIERELRS